MELIAWLNTFFQRHVQAMKEYPNTREEWREFPASLSDSELEIGGFQVMQAWEEPLMDALAREVTLDDGDILEVGFGMGISAEKVIQHGCDTYSVIEPHPAVIDHFEDWCASHDIPTTLYEGFWQEVLPDLDREFDGILFDTFPLSEEELGYKHLDFLPAASGILADDGRLTYWSDETTDSIFKDGHAETLFDTYDRVELKKVDDLQPPPDCDYWSADHMIVIIVEG